jgi:hypothetical protein
METHDRYMIVYGFYLPFLRFMALSTIWFVIYWDGHKSSVGGRDRVGIVTRKIFGSLPKLGSRPKILTGRDPKFFRILYNRVCYLVFSWFSCFFTLGHDPIGSRPKKKFGSWPELRSRPQKNPGRDRESGRPTRSITPNTT